jgi:acyl-CoA reductase-like NAD-dependent aldehyde dehydrogenase
MSEIAKHWIDGEWTGSDTISESVNPATGAVLGPWANGGEAEARAAIAAARRAFDTSPWSRDRSLRHRALNEMAEGFDARAEELGTLVTKENGKKIAEGMLEGTSPGPHAPAHRGPGPDRHRHGVPAAGLSRRPRPQSHHVR